MSIGGVSTAGGTAGISVGRCRHPGASLTWLHPTQRPWPFAALVAPPSACRTTWSIWRIGALQ